MATKKKGRDSDTEIKEKGAGTASDDAGGKVSDDKPSKKEAPKSKHDEESGQSLSLQDIVQFLREVVIEFKKISWPTRRQVMQETASVLVLVTIITLAVLGFDWAVGKFIFGPLGEWARHLGGGVGAG